MPQIVYYVAGVGTGLFDSVFGKGLEQDVKNGYLFLAHNFSCGDGEYKPDEIYVFGFSRGAFMARSLCGFIDACKGLIHTDALHKLDACVEISIVPSDPSANKFEHYQDIERSVKEAYIDCIGVWDTVGALGIPTTWSQYLNKKRYAFHDNEISYLVRHAFQAIAIDENAQARSCRRYGVARRNLSMTRSWNRFGFQECIPI